MTWPAPNVTPPKRRNRIADIAQAVIALALFVLAMVATDQGWFERL